MASLTEGLVPITRAYLALYYDKYPAPALSEDVARLTAELQVLSNVLLKESLLASGEPVVEEVDRDPPHKVDENLWKNREQIEEILYLLDKSNLPHSLQLKAVPEDADIAMCIEDLQVPLHKTLKAVEMFQSKNADYVFNAGVHKYICSDDLHAARFSWNAYQAAKGALREE